MPFFWFLGEKSVTICEGKSGKTQCAPNNIVIEDAKYGSDQGCSCECGKCYIQSIECAATEVVEKVRQKCQQQRVCHLQATTKEFGDPCENVLKRLIVKYSCK